MTWGPRIHGIIENSHNMTLSIAVTDTLCTNAAFELEPLMGLIYNLHNI